MINLPSQQERFDAFNERQTRRQIEASLRRIDPPKRWPPAAFNVKEWGAVGDGTTDDSAVFQAVIDAASLETYGATVFIPKGDYKIATGLTFSTSASLGRYVNLVGDGWGSRLIWTGGGSACITVPGGVAAGNFRFADFRLEGTGVASEVGIYLGNDAVNYGCVIEHLWLSTLKVGIKSGNDSSGGSFDLSIRDCLIALDSDYKGIVLNYNSNSCTVDNCWINTDDMTADTSTGIYIGSCAGVRVTNCDIECYTDIEITRSSGKFQPTTTYIGHNYFETAKLGALVLKCTDDTHTIFEGNIVNISSTAVNAITLSATTDRTVIAFNHFDNAGATAWVIVTAGASKISGIGNTTNGGTFWSTTTGVGMDLRGDGARSFMLNDINIGGSAAAIGFYGVTETTRQVLATGAGRTVDDVITALQTLGLVKQS